MRLCLPLLVTLLAAAPPIAAQAPAVSNGWHLGGGADALRFAQVAVSEVSAGVDAEFRPSGRVDFHLALGRSVGPWDVSIEAGWAEGHVEAGTELLTIRDLASDVTRYRLALGVGRRLTAIGVGSLGIVLASTLDLWSVSGSKRVRAGAEARVVLHVPVGSFELEHRLGIGLSGSPIDAADLGVLADERGLRTLLIGVGLRSGL